jgi:cell division protein FtsN
MKFQAGGFALGLIAGLLLGLALALGVAIYITKTPVPFIDKVPQRTAEQDSAEAERNKDWNPNAPLAPSAPVRAAAPASAAVSPAASGVVGAAALPASAAPPTAAPPARDPAAILAGQVPSTARPPPPAPGPAASAADPFVYLVQAGAYSRAEDAEQQRAKLALLGLEARVTEREQSGRTVYRVRVGPFDARTDADAAQQLLQQSGVEGQLVRVQRP